MAEAVAYEDTVVPGSSQTFLTELLLAARARQIKTEEIAAQFTKGETQPAEELSKAKQKEKVEEKEVPGLFKKTDYDGVIAALTNIPYTKDGFKALNEQNLPVPLGILAMTPWKTYSASSTLATVKGKAVVTFTCPGSCVVVDQSNMKRFITCYVRMGAGVIEPRNIAMAPGTFVKKYLHGDTLDPVDPAKFQPNAHLIKGCTIYAPVPWAWRKNKTTLCLLPSMIPNLQGFFKDEEDTFLYDHGYPSVQTMDMIFRFTAHGCGRHDRRFVTLPYSREPDPINVFLRRASYMCRDTNSGQYTLFVTGKGYWGQDATYPGAGFSRDGGVFAFNPSRGKVTYAP